MKTPRNVVVILFDSLNRHMIGAYGGKEFATPNLDRVARRAVRFDRHYTGSLPCMPARHDILCGALDFLWRCWGSVEIWEDAITYALRQAGVATQLISDHPHLFETGGENYHIDFGAWSYERGHESDAWKLRPDPSWAGAPSFGRGHMPYDNSRGYFRGEADFPGPRTMQAAADWLDAQARAFDRFLLFVDEFDPHEPFDTPEPWAGRYDGSWDGPRLIWPPYMQGAVAQGVLSERQARHLRANYGAKLSMIDHWFGRILDAMDRNDLWQDTLFIACADHGHYLGEKDIWGKPGVPVFNPLGHIPLLISCPGVAPGARSALTTSVDIFVTIAEVFGVNVRQRTHGVSLLPVLQETASSVRDHVLTGVWGREVCLVTPQHKYVRAPGIANAPLSMLSNRWSTMPNPVLERAAALPLPDARAFLDRMPGSSVPVIHQTFADGDPVPFWARVHFSGNHVYDLDADPGEQVNLAGADIEEALAAKLRSALAAMEAPATQFERLGL
ncbi:MAG: sulfatase [Gammaproteobacteria bacterium]|nr:sulfatase [Gammaproteobacteria bacterium]